MDTIKITEADICDMYRLGLEQKPVDFSMAMEVMTCLQLIETSAPYIHADIIDQVFALLPTFCLLLKHPLKAVS